MTMIEVDAPTWDELDRRLAAIQVMVRWGITHHQGEVLVEMLKEMRDDLAALRAVERASKGAPVVTEFLDHVEPVAEAAVSVPCPWRYEFAHDTPQCCSQEAGHKGLHGGPVLWWSEGANGARKKGARR